MTRPTDPLFDQRIADWLEDDPLHAPDQVLEIVLAALPSIPRRRPFPAPWRFTTMPTSIRWPLAAAAVIGVLVLGGALYLNRPSQPSVGGPSPTPGLSAGPSQPANPTPGPSPTAVPARTASWTATGSLVRTHYSHTATLLPNGRVLVAGGGDRRAPLASAELYDPATRTWTATDSMTTGRTQHTATLLRDGRVLVAGGRGSTGPLASAELYDPATGTWTATGSMTIQRADDHTATLLPDGRVLVAGGSDSEVALDAAELYDPATGTWTATGRMTTARLEHTATLLRDGKVLVAGGYIGSGPLASAELYDPATGTWTATNNMTTVREKNTATLLRDGRVLVVGRGFELNPTRWGATAELYDPGTGSWTATGTMVTKALADLTATLLPDGNVLVAGGNDLMTDPAGPAVGLAQASAELYDPASGTWTATASMLTPLDHHTATLLPDGTVLVAGGVTGGGDHLVLLTSTELYDPGTGR